VGRHQGERRESSQTPPRKTRKRSLARLSTVILLLPGLDGTGRLFARIEPILARTLDPHVVSYPTDRPFGYRELLERIDVPAGPFAIIAESFSGPLGVLLASRYLDRVRALVLVATFVRSPRPLVARLGASLGTTLFRWRPPDIALRWGLLGMDASNTDVRDSRAAIESVAPTVLAHRLREVSRVDVSNEFGSIAAPTLYLAGMRDRLVGSSVRRELGALRPDMKMCVLDAPHLVLQSDAEAAANIINEFLLTHLGSQSLPLTR
jgi:pimeloyl-[acyl-carrier protein] methyl ester esterase